MAQHEVMFAGFGGQGIMTAGQLLAYAGIKEGKQVAWIPSYGPEMRGGTAYCTVVVSETRIGSPIVTTPRSICVFNRPSFDKFEPKVHKGGLLIVNSSLIDVSSSRKDIDELLVPANEMALRNGNPRAANVAVLGALIGMTGVVGWETLQATVREKLGRKAEMLEKNMKVLEEGYQMAMERAGRKDRV